MKTASANFDEPASLPLSSAGDVETLVRARGSLFVVTDRHGDIAPAGARELGLFFEDTRYLSHFALEVANVQVVHIGADTSDDAFNQINLMLTGMEAGAFLDDPQNFLHIRRRQLLDDAFIEEISFTNFLRQEVTLDVSLAFDADFADIFEVRGAKRPKRGTRRPADVGERRVSLSYRGLDGEAYGTHVAFSPAPAKLTPHRAQFLLRIPAGASTSVDVSVRPERGRVKEAVRHAFRDRAARLQEEAIEVRNAGTTFRCDNAVLQGVLEQAVSDLRSLRITFGEHAILGAGIPWFCAPFGRDSLLASYEALSVDPSLAVASLRTLAAYQGKRFNDATEEEPGKIFHELRFGEMARAGETPHSPYYGSIDATPLFVIVADAAYRMTADLGLLRELRPAIVAALEWIDAQSEGGTRYVAYARKTKRGLDNQGWKDSRAGVSFPDGTLAVPPIALCEVQGYCIDAYRRGARILSVLGETELAQAYERKGEAFRSKFEAEWWLEDKRRYAFALDGDNRFLDTVVSNLGHLLWSRVPSSERANATADLLMSRASFSGFGIRTLAEAQPVYNPLSYHNGTVWPHDNAVIAKGMANYRLTRQSNGVFEGLIEAMAYVHDRRPPELFAGLEKRSGALVRYPVACSPQAWSSAAPFLLLQSALGIHANAPERRLAIRNACLPPSVRRLDIEGMWVGDARVTLRFRQVNGRCHVDRLDVQGGALRTEIEID